MAVPGTSCAPASPARRHRHANCLRIIRKSIKANPDIFGDLEFPGSLERAAQPVLGRPGDPRRTAFHRLVDNGARVIGCNACPDRLAA